SAALLLAACGGGGHPSGSKPVVVPAYGDHPATTVAAGSGGANCAVDAQTFLRDSRIFLDHYGAEAAYPADLYYVILREDFADFQARACAPAVLGKALRAGLSAAERRRFVDALPATMAGVVRQGL